MTNSLKVNPEKKSFDIYNDSALIIPIILCLFLFISSVLVVFPDLGVFNSKRLFQIGIIPFVLLVAVFHPQVRKVTGGLINQTPNPIKLLAGLFFVLGITSSLRFSHPAYSLVEVGLLFSLVLLMYVIAGVRVLTGQRFDRLCLIFILALGVAVTLQEFMGLLANLSIGRGFSYDDMFIYFSHPRFYNQLQTWSIPLIAALPFVFTSSKKAWIIAILLLAFQWYLLFASGARGSVVGLSFAIAIVGLLTFSSGKKWLAVQIGGALSGLAIFFSIFLVQKLQSTGGGQFIAESLGRDMTHSMGRTTFWKYAWNDVLQNPWLGAGPGRFACSAEIALPAHPHNMVMQLFSEWGFPATLLALAVIIILGWQLLRQVRLVDTSSESNSALLKLSLAMALIAAAIHSGVSGLLVMPASSMMATVIAGWLLGVMSRPISEIDKNTLSNTVLLSGMVISIALLTFGYHEIRQMEYRMKGFSISERQMPRFWNQGRVCRYTY